MDSWSADSALNFLQILTSVSFLSSLSSHRPLLRLLFLAHLRAFFFLSFSFSLNGLTFHRSNEKSNLTSCWYTCWVQLFHKSQQYRSNGTVIWWIQQRTPLVFCAMPSIVLTFKVRIVLCFFLCMKVFKERAIVIFKNWFLVRIVCHADTSESWCRHCRNTGRKGGWDTEKNGYCIHVHVQCHHLHGWTDAWVCECTRYFRSVLTLRIHGSCHKHHMVLSFSWSWWERHL